MLRLAWRGFDRPGRSRPVTAPARELAELYKARWEIETALGSL